MVDWWQPKLFPKPVSACDLSGDFGWNLPIIAHATSPRGKDHLTAVGRWVPKSGSGCWLELLFIGNRSSQGSRVDASLDADQFGLCFSCYFLNFPRLPLIVK